MEQISWEKAKEIVDEVYGSGWSLVGEDEDEFICPECEDPILREDYPILDFCRENKTFICPVCENEIG
jgi:predicted RNA-binding Zn-ribbon protein involved in translation (DUF1610 family)